MYTEYIHRVMANSTLLCVRGSVQKKYYVRTQQYELTRIGPPHLGSRYVLTRAHAHAHT